MPRRTRKVLIFITQHARLLVFRHTGHPPAGIQVPAGTIEPGEDIAAAALREASEETGLKDIHVDRLLGEYDYSMAAFGRDEVQHRFVFAATLASEAPSTWCHYEAHPSGDGDPIPFDFVWLDLTAAHRDLIAGQGTLLERLDESLQSATP